MTHDSAAHVVTWVLVADEHIARLFELPASGALHEVETLVDDDARARGAEFRDDAQGRRAPATAAGGPGGGPALGAGSVTSSAGESELHQEAQRFAHRVAAALAHWHQKGRFTHLRLIAAPRFLGLLRTELGAALAALVTGELSKDLTQINAAELTRRLFPEHDGPRRHLDPKSAQELKSGNKDIMH